MKRRHPESEAQRAFIRRVRLDARTKHLLLTAVPMGGKRNAREAAILKMEGALAGCPDILCFEPGMQVMADDPPPGLALEFKHGNNKPTPAQLWWHRELRRVGWQVNVVYGAEEAWDTLLDYLGMKR